MSLATTLQQHGFVFLPQHKPTRETADVAAELGRPVSLGGGSAVHELTPKQPGESTSNTYSGLYGLAVFPFHTDLAHWVRPPRYLLLRALVGFVEVPTLVVDGRTIVEDVGIRPLHRALFRPRRRRRNISTSLLRLYQDRDECEPLMRWDEKFIVPASEAGVVGAQLFAKSLSRIMPNMLCLVERGDTLLLDNWRMLHARAAVPEHCRNRLLHRVYMEDIL